MAWTVGPVPRISVVLVYTNASYILRLLMNTNNTNQKNKARKLVKDAEREK